MDINIKNNALMSEEALKNVAGGSYEILSSGNGYSISDYSPRWNVGDVLRINYNDTTHGICKAKCTVRGISSERNGGISGMEYTYTIQIVWLPASCPAAATDIGKIYYNVAESSLYAG